MERIVFVDTEVGNNGKVLDYGAAKSENDGLHTGLSDKFTEFISGNRFVCGHNIFRHDIKFIENEFGKSGIEFVVDTLFLSPLLFPNKPYHALLKDDKLQTEELNNPLNDAKKAMTLFYDEVTAFKDLDRDLQNIYCALLYEEKEFYGFFRYIDFKPQENAVQLIKKRFEGKICGNCDIEEIVKTHPTELAYCLALITASNNRSVIPHWVHKNFPRVENVMRSLRNTPCGDCEYCRSELDIHKKLKKIFGYDDFRKYDGEPLQENAVGAAVNNRSLIAVFPTGGGKSLTFQLPALMAGETVRGLTVVISPLQSLMKDQVDNLRNRKIVGAVTINGMLDPIERANAIESVENGLADILYISPESLRSKTIERLLLGRNVVRFVIDEAHCFSAWGQDFRVDYLYIGDFIRELQEKKGLDRSIPVSCFTATAKQKVISDIKEYFKAKLGLELELYTSSAARTNLRYEVLFKETDEEKYVTMRSLIEQKNCPTIVYASRVHRTKELAEKLCRDGFKARAYYGKMDNSEKAENQEAFINDEVQIIVATSAFGMGVDKSNVRLVIHYDISDSLENYVQEAGRAGRDPNIEAECYVLFNNEDLDKHFILLNQTKLSIAEIQQIWKAIKEFTKTRPVMWRSALEIARQAGWDESRNREIETRVTQAVAALENAGYIKRGKNVPRVFATSIRAANMNEASAIIERSARIADEKQKFNAKRIIKSLISSRSRADAGNEEAESRVDYIAENLGIEKYEVISLIELMREDGLLEDSKDMTAYIRRNETKNRSAQILNQFLQLEEFMLNELGSGKFEFNIKELNEKALNSGIKRSSVSNIKTIIYFWTIKCYIKKGEHSSADDISAEPQMSIEKFIEKRRKCGDISRFIVDHLFDKSLEKRTEKEEVLVQFSLMELKNEYEAQLRFDNMDIAAADVEEALLYLSKTSSMRLEGGFLVLYSTMEIQRLETDNKIRYKVDDYKYLDEHYKQKIQQIHIVGEYANMMVRDYDAALAFVSDYFGMDYKKFIGKYFKDGRSKEIEQSITPQKYQRIAGVLSERQRQIIDDKQSRCIVVAAGPGSGKTRVLVHKLASLLMLEDVKHEQLLMVTFSRAAATEFKQRLVELVGNAVGYLDIKTFHSYCFDLIGKVGSLENSDNVVANAVEMIRNGEVEANRIAKAVVVIDEAQDMDVHEYELICELMAHNEDIRVIAVGDDDQNIYEFRGSSAKYMRSFITDKGAVQYDLLDNYRSKQSIVNYANAFVQTISGRMKFEPVAAVQKEAGAVRIVKCESENMEILIVEHIKKHPCGGSTCILTNTNDEAFELVGMLLREGIKAKLIQDNDGFEIRNIAEVRCFLDELGEYFDDSIISDIRWDSAKDKLKARYKESEFLPMCLYILEEFEKTGERKYYSDFEDYIRESSLEYFFKEQKEEVLVSTMHKAKGREFDRVCLMYKAPKSYDDAERRKLYVGMTRARNELNIFYHGPYFDNIKSENAQKYYCRKNCPEPGEMVMQLGYKDVYLNSFKKKQNDVSGIYSGQELEYKNGCLYFSGKNIVEFSSRCRERINNKINKGYRICKAVVRLVIIWKCREDGREYYIVLPDIYFRKG